MGIVYHGKLDHLRRSVDEVKEALNEGYREILGNRRYAQLEAASARLLNRDSFFDSVDAYNEALGGSLPRDASNKMTLATTTDIDIGPDGQVKNKKIRTAVSFYISDNGFDNSHSASFTDEAVASYVHEFDHFVAYALQSAPIYLAHLVVSGALGYPAGSLKDYVRSLEGKDIPPTEMTKGIALAQLGAALTETYEKLNRIIDRAVLRKIGIDVPLPWREKKRKQEIIPLPTGAMIVSKGGDPFYGRSDQKAIDDFLRWHEIRSTPTTHPFSLNLINSVKNLKVSRVPLSELMKDQGKKRRTKKGRRRC